MISTFASLLGILSLGHVYYIVRSKSIFSMSAILLTIMSIIPYFMPVKFYSETWMFTKEILQAAINSSEEKLIVNAFTFLILTSFTIISQSNILPKINFYPYTKVPLTAIFSLLFISQIMHSIGQRAISDYFTVATTILMLSIISNLIIYKNKITLKVLFVLIIYAVSVILRGATKELVVLIVPAIYLIFYQDIKFVNRTFKFVFLALLGIALFALRELFRLVYWYGFDVKVSNLFALIFYETERTYSIIELLIVRAQNYYWNVGTLINVTDSLSNKFQIDWLWALVPRPIFPLKPTELRNANEFGREIGFLSQSDFTTAANIPLVSDLIVLSEGNLWMGLVYMLAYTFVISISIGSLLHLMKKEKLLNQFFPGAALSIAAWLMVAVDSGIVVWGTLWFKLFIAIIIIYLLKRLKLV